METNAVVALIAGAFSLVGALFAYRASTQANAVSKQKVDSEVYDRSQQMYERMLGNADRELSRLQGQVDRLNSQLERTNDLLAQEKDVSNTLRSHVSTLQRQVGVMEETMNSLRTQLNVDVDPTRRARGTRRDYPPAGSGHIENLPRS